MKLMRKKNAKLALLGLFLGFSIAFGNMVSIVSTSPAYIVANLEIPSVNTSEEKDITYWWLEPYFVYAAYWTSFVEPDIDGDGFYNMDEINNYKTNPWDNDTDGDGMLDGYEIWVGIWGQSWQDPLVYNERYAVLLVGGQSAGGSVNSACYWNEMVRTYDTLVEGYNYKPENILVFYADGEFPYEGNTDGFNNGWVLKDSAQKHHDMSILPATRDDINRVLRMLCWGITSNDSLFFWVSPHGIGRSIAPYSAICLYGESEPLYDFDFTSYFINAEFAQAIFVMGQCYSGGFLDPSLMKPDFFRNEGDLNPIIAPGDSDLYLNLNDLGDRYGKNVIVITSTDFQSSTGGLTNGFIHDFWRYIAPFSYINSEDIVYSDDPYDWSIEWILGDYDISWEALMTGKAWYLKQKDSTPFRDSNAVVSMWEAYWLCWWTEVPTSNRNDTGSVNRVQYYESSDGLMESTYL